MGWRDSLQRRDEVRAAFFEGFRLTFGMRGDLAEVSALAEDAWRASHARDKLERPLDIGAEPPNSGEGADSGDESARHAPGNSPL